MHESVYNFFDCACCVILVKRERMNLAHFLTLLRIGISPLFPLFYLGHKALGIPFVWVPYILLILVTLCESSDLFDGFWARRNNQVTDLGKVLDPMADTITHVTLFITFTQGIVNLPVSLVFIFLYRDLLVSTLRTVCALKGVALAARVSGKIKAIIQAAACLTIIVLMIPYTMGFLSLVLFQQISVFVVWIAALYTALSFGDYILANRIYIRQAFQKQA